jgi:uncharacterized protein (DUF983 family)
MPERSASTLFSRALHLRCPCCGEGPLFLGWFRMHERCSECQLKYERSPGYFLGSTYINYGQTSLIMSAAYLILYFGYNVPKEWLAPPLAAFCVLWPLFWFRYARALFLAFDLCFDASESEDGEDDESEN